MSDAVAIAAAGWAVSLTTACAILGRVLACWLLGRLPPHAVACGNFALQALALLLLALHPPGLSLPALYLGCALFGLTVGNMTSLPSLLVQARFAKQDFNRTVSLIVSVNQFTYAGGPAALEWLRDLSGSYGAGLLLLAGLQVAAGLGIVLPRLLRFRA